MPFGSSRLRRAASALVSAPVQYPASVYPISVSYSRLFPDKSIEQQGRKEPGIALFCYALKELFQFFSSS
jgi:hypothetical protein